MNFIGRQWSRGKKNEKADKELNYKRDKSEKKKNVNPQSTWFSNNMKV